MVRKRKRFDVQDNVMQYIIIILIMILIIILTYLFTSVYISNKYDCFFKSEEYSSYSISVSNESIYNNILYTCKDVESKKNRLFCLFEEVKPYYRFMDEDIMHNGTVFDPEYTLNNGGVCRDWTRVYVSLAKDLGFNATGFIFKNDGWPVSHEISVITSYDNETNSAFYCWVDAISYNCEALSFSPSIVEQVEAYYNKSNNSN